MNHQAAAGPAENGPARKNLHAVNNRVRAVHA
jgi:hypothetical protein